MPRERPQLVSDGACSPGRIARRGSASGASVTAAQCRRIASWRSGSGRSSRPSRHGGRRTPRLFSRAQVLDRIGRGRRERGERRDRAGGPLDGETAARGAGVRDLPTVQPTQPPAPPRGLQPRRAPSAAPAGPADDGRSRRGDRSGRGSGHPGAAAAHPPATAWGHAGVASARREASTMRAVRARHHIDPTAARVQAHVASSPQG